ncbi:MAG: PBP1A family penicillin-binding protein [Ruminococcaceae bacterium]|nr:PBP1A family penicillin-binding protein [Oscillospiraceae bacterium]
MSRGLRLFLKVFLTTFLIGALIASTVIVGGCFGFFGLDKGFDVNALDLNFTSIVYYTDENGNAHELERLYKSQNRVWADISEIPKYMQDAFVAIEDERFYKHNGVDVARTLKATVTYVFKGSSSFGGSTITQQLVKNITGDKSARPTRKVREMWRAMALERKYSKEQILEIYLNTIYLANNCNGVQSAANKYFGKDISELSLAQCASIAGITQYPSKYDPLQNPENNIEKQRIVLAKMLELGKITQEEYDAAIAEKLDFENHSLKSGENVQSYFIDQLINELIADLQKDKGYSAEFAEKTVYNGGLKIYATIDPAVQEAMEDVYENNANFPRVYGSVTPQSAMVVLDVHTGAVKGSVGGIGKKSGDRILNRASQSYRQPGSTIKPIAVYAPAIEQGKISPSSIVEDAPIDINGWKPTNYYSGYKGNVTVRNALKESMNTPAIRVLQQVGVDYSYDFMTKKLGFTSLVDNETRNGKKYTDKNLSSLALGGLTDGVNVTELAAAYATFANNGLYNKPHLYTKVVNSEGDILLENKAQPTVAMSEATAFMTNSMLQSVITNGTGTAARLSGSMPAGGKTGTTDDQNDRWFAGFTPYYSAVVWYGYDQPKSLEFLSYHPCMPVWKKVMNEIHKNLPVRSFNMPSTVDSAQVCSLTGKLATDGCTKITEYFKTGKRPTSYCSGHADVDTTVDENIIDLTPETEEEQIPEDAVIPDDITNPSDPVAIPSEIPSVPSQPSVPDDDIIVLD